MTCLRSETYNSNPNSILTFNNILLIKLIPMNGRVFKNHDGV